MLTTALDAARLGARAPLSPGFLRAAAPDYCTSQQQAKAPPDWFDQALAYATKELNGAAAALSPAGTGIMGEITGYTPADYLIQHVSRERRYARVPASTWDAILSHIGDPADAARLADSAERRLLYRYAIQLYRHAADVGDQAAARDLARLLAQRGDSEELHARADAGDRHAAWWLAGLLAESGDSKELHARADAGDLEAAVRLAVLLAESGDEEGLRARAGAGDRYAALALAWLLADRGDLDGTAQILRAPADAGDPPAALLLAWRLADRDDLDEAVQILRAPADAGDPAAARLLAGLLADRGDLEGLRARADAGDPAAARLLAGLLAERGDLDEAMQILRALADVGDWAATRLLAGLLARLGDLDGAAQILRPPADVGLLSFRFRRVFPDPLLADLRPRADAGDLEAAMQLADLLAEQGDLDVAVQVLDKAAQILRARADTDNGHGDAQMRYKAGQTLRAQTLRAHAEQAGHDLDAAFAVFELREPLVERHDLYEGSVGTGAQGYHISHPDPWRKVDQLAADLLAKQGDSAEAAQIGAAQIWDKIAQILRAQADAGDGDATLLTVVLIKQGRGEEAERLRRFGLNPDGSIACA